MLAAAGWNFKKMMEKLKKESIKILILVKKRSWGPRFSFFYVTS